MNLRERAKNHVFYKLGNGRNVSAWFDRWNSEGPLSEFISNREIYNARLRLDCTVEDLVVDNNWCWPMDWRNKFPRLKDIQVPMLNSSCEDKAMWVTNSGKKTEYATKTAWSDLSSNGNTVVWKDVVWYAQNIPRHSFVLWLAVQERLMTQDRLAAWKQDDELRCTFCNLCQDSHEHLFFQCQYTGKVWCLMQEFIDKRFSFNWKSIIDEFSKLKANRSIWSTMRRLVLGATVYFVWQERNARLFKDKERSAETLVQNIMDSIKWRIMSFTVNDSAAVKEVETKWNVKIKRAVR